MRRPSPVEVSFFLSSDSPDRNSPYRLVRTIDLALVAGGGMQIATSEVHTYNHELALTASDAVLTGERVVSWPGRSPCIARDSLRH